MIRSFLILACAAAMLSGCRTSYSWTSTVPEQKRTVCVPTFRNESKVTELGSLASRQLLREFQREGTFRVAHPDDAVIEIQGVIRGASGVHKGGARRLGYQLNNYELNVAAVVSVVDRSSGKVIIENRLYTAQAPFVSNDDVMTNTRNASARAAEDLARQVVDDVLAYQW